MKIYFKKLEFLISISIICTLMIFSRCKEEEIITSNTPAIIYEQNDKNVFEEDGIIELGDLINDPYSLENMEKAYS
jgi:hypothetical protein